MDSWVQMCLMWNTSHSQLVMAWNQSPFNIFYYFLIFPQLKSLYNHCFCVWAKIPLISPKKLKWTEHRPPLYRPSLWNKAQHLPRVPRVVTWSLELEGRPDIAGYRLLHIRSQQGRRVSHAGQGDGYGDRCPFTCQAGLIGVFGLQLEIKVPF